MTFFQIKPLLQNEKELSRFFLLLAMLLTLLAYLPVAENHFINWDDTNYIQFNPHIRRLTADSLRWMFASFYAGYWIPLTWLSYAVDFQIGMLEPWVYHLDNLILHLLNTALVFLISKKTLELTIQRSLIGFKSYETAWSSFGTSLLFGLHPLHVESVAWAAERKDLLYGFFFLLSLWTYLKNNHSPN